MQTMITASNFLTKGRTGNILFRYASLIGIAKKYNKELRLPFWEDSIYFEGIFPEGEIEGNCRDLKETTFHYVPEWPAINENENVDIDGYLQSERYWEHCKEDVLKALTFKEEFKEQIRQGFDFSKPTIAISIRRGDYVGHDCYFQLNINYFYLSLQEFKDWRECNIIVFSDDIPYCRVHFGCLSNVQFSENNSPIEDLCLMSQCDRHIISNSTFSYWGAYLSQSKQVIRPNGLFDGKLLRLNDDKDFWPEPWTIFDHINKRIELTDVTFVIPVMYDHPDRQQNLELCVKILQKNFDTNILIGEQKAMHFEYLSQSCDYLFFEGMTVFHRTKMLNEMFRHAKTPIIFNWDADVIIAPVQVMEAVLKLRSGIEMVYPYDERTIPLVRLFPEKSF